MPPPWINCKVCPSLESINAVLKNHARGLLRLEEAGAVTNPIADYADAVVGMLGWMRSMGYRQS